MWHSVVYPFILLIMGHKKCCLWLMGLTLGTSLLLPITVYAENQEEIFIRPDLKKGDRIILKRIKTREGFASDSKTPPIIGRNNVIIEVLESSGKSFLVRWRNEEFELPTQNIEVKGFLERMQSFSKDLILDIEFDRDGNLIELKNWREVQNQYKKMTELLLDYFRPHLSLSGFSALSDKYRTMYETKEALQATVLKEPMMYLFPWGKSIATDHPTRYSIAMQKDRNGNPLPFLIEVSLHNYQSDAPDINIITQTEYDPDQLGHAMDEFLQNFRHETKDITPITELAISVKEEGRYCIERKTGWIVHAEYIKTIQIDGRKGIDTILWQRVDPESRPSSRPSTLPSTFTPTGGKGDRTKQPEKEDANEPGV